mgnify:CR=1 FL=1
MWCGGCRLNRFLLTRCPHQVVTHFSKHKEQLNEVFLRCGQKELKFIERSGAYFGFLFGLVQAVVWFFVPEWCGTVLHL